MSSSRRNSHYTKLTSATFKFLYVFRQYTDSNVHICLTCCHAVNNGALWVAIYHRLGTPISNPFSNMLCFFSKRKQSCLSMKNATVIDANETMNLNCVQYISTIRPPDASPNDRLSWQYEWEIATRRSRVIMRLHYAARFKVDQFTWQSIRRKCVSCFYVSIWNNASRLTFDCAEPSSLSLFVFQFRTSGSISAERWKWRATHNKVEQF